MARKKRTDSYVVVREVLNDDIDTQNMLTMEIGAREDEGYSLVGVCTGGNTPEGYHTVYLHFAK